MTFTVKTMYAEYPNCLLSVRRYANNNHIAISVYSPEEGPIADITVNIRGIENQTDIDKSCVDTNNFPEATRLIRELGIGKYTSLELVSGWCAYPVYEFDMDKVEKYTKEDA